MFGSPTKGRWSYACSKAYDESLALAYDREHDLPAILCDFSIRLALASQRSRVVLPRFVRQALSSSPLTAYGDGTQTRCFGYVGDAVRAMVQLSEQPRAFGGVFNLGNPQEIQIAD